MAGRELGAVTVPIGAAYWSLLPERLGLWLLRRAPQHLGLYLHPQELGPDPQRIGMPAQAGPRRHAQATCARRSCCSSAHKLTFATCVVSVALGRDLASRIPGASFVELSGADDYPSTGDVEVWFGRFEDFLVGGRRVHRPLDRVLSTVLFTDIVGST